VTIEKKERGLLSEWIPICSCPLCSPPPSLEWLVRLCQILVWKLPFQGTFLRWGDPWRVPVRQGQGQPFSLCPGAGHISPANSTHWTPVGGFGWTGPCQICFGQSIGTPPHIPQAAHRCGSQSPGSQTSSSWTPGGPWQC
jgi:hypothetical protein